MLKWHFFLNRNTRTKSGDKCILFNETVQNIEDFFLSFFSWPFTYYRTAGEWRGHFVTPHYHFHPLLKHLHIGQATTAESSPLHITSDRPRTGGPWFPSASRWRLSYPPWLSESHVLGETHFIKREQLLEK